MIGAIRLMLLLAAAVLVVGRVCAQTVVVLPGFSLGNHISDDGRVVSGLHVPEGSSNYDYFMWSQARGFFLPGMGTNQSPANGAPQLSGDGHSIAAYGGDATGRSFIVRDTGVVTTIPSLGQDYPQAVVAGLSYDGTVAAGYGYNNSQGFQGAWRWTASGGLQVLFGGAATCISGDGRVVVGTPGGGLGIIWRDGEFSRLPLVPGSLGTTTGGNATNFDGSIIVGSSGGRAARWINGQGVFLPPVGATNPQRPTDVSEDGQVIVGHISGNVQNDVFIWTPSRGSELITTYFASFGVNLSGYSVREASVNASGDTFALATYPTGTSTGQTLIITVPSPGVGFVLAGLIFRPYRRARMS